ncbi:hypothetical protein ACFU8T_17050, partial [Sphingobacterium spiritivorum]|uniref:hypothetical protein n=1 Tax=Sphingobacterium spiritivorum TaxID=258 RepID=UPI00367E161E
RWYCRNRWESRSVPFFIRKPFLETDKGFFVFKNVIPETKPEAKPEANPNPDITDFIIQRVRHRHKHRCAHACAIQMTAIYRERG